MIGPVSMTDVSTSAVMMRLGEEDWPPDRDPELRGRNGHYTVLEKRSVGSGAFGRVFKVRKHATDVAPAQECALKVFGPAGLVDYEHEVMCLQTVHSCRIPHTIEYVDHLEDPDIGPFIVTRPYCQTSLERVLEAWTEAGTTDKPLLPYDSLLWISANLAQALVELHERGLVHADIAPRNILLEHEGRAAIRLIDFGVSCDVTTKPESFPKYKSVSVPPELRAGKPSPGPVDVKKADSYGLGCLLYCLFTMDGRWLKADEAGAIEHLHSVMTGPDAAAVAQAIDSAWEPLKVDRELAPLIAGLLAEDPATRLDMKSAMRRLVDMANAETGRRTWGGSMCVYAFTWVLTAAVIGVMGVPRGHTAVSAVALFLQGLLVGTSVYFLLAAYLAHVQRRITPSAASAAQPRFASRIESGRLLLSAVVTVLVIGFVSSAVAFGKVPRQRLGWAIALSVLCAVLLLTHAAYTFAERQGTAEFKQYISREASSAAPKLMTCGLIILYRVADNKLSPDLLPACAACIAALLILYHGSRIIKAFKQRKRRLRVKVARAPLAAMLKDTAETV